MFNDWLNLYKRIREGVTKSELTCPECSSGGSVDFQYVGSAEKRIGYLDIWCTSCNKGVHFSRVSIPEGFSLISFDDPDQILVARIPNFEQVVPQEGM